jgi:hypothetical protein
LRCRDPADLAGPTEGSENGRDRNWGSTLAVAVGRVRPLREGLAAAAG